MKPGLYLDHNATTPVLPEAAAAVAAALAAGGNPSSVHAAGRRARAVVEEARDAIAALLGVPDAEVVFTSGGTEANAMAVALAADEGRAVLMSAVEHDSLNRAAAGAETVAVGHDGVIDLDSLERRLASLGQPAYLMVMLANNETGVIQPVSEVVRIARAHGARVHCDAAQAAGRMEVDLAALGVDSATVSAHKMGGPQGCGALVVADATRRPVALLAGGGQERGWRAGTENVPGLAGFGAAARAAAAGGIARWQALAPLRDYLEGALSRRAPDAVIVGAAAERLANTTCVSLPGVAAETQVMALDLAGMMVSAGAACSSGKVKPSHVLGAMGLETAVVRGAIRVSLGPETRREDIDGFVKAWGEMRTRLAEPKQTRTVSAA